MLKSCPYCGRIHDSRIDCGAKPVRRSKVSKKDKFRSSRQWQAKRQEIKQRDRYLCQVCIRGLYGVGVRYYHEGLEVHHAVPLEEDYELRLADGNLLTLCQRHHEMAESGEIPREIILDIITQQEQSKP